MFPIKILWKALLILNINIDQAKPVLKEKLPMDNILKQRKLNRMYHHITTLTKKIMRLSMVKLLMGKLFDLMT
jgi:hypothetical protein